MKVLFVTPYLPGPPLFGGARRINGLMREIAKDCDVSIFSLVNPAEDIEPALAAARSYCENVEVVADALHRVEGRPKRLIQLASMLVPYSYEKILHERRKVQRALTEHLTRHAYDLIVFEFSFMATFKLPKPPRGRRAPVLILDEHNVEYDLLRRTAEATGGTRRLFHEVNWRKLRHEEVGIWKRFDAVALTSRRDEQLLLDKLPGTTTAVVPNGVDVEDFAPRDVPVTARTMLFFGAINYYPNTDGAVFFADQVLPLIRQTHPDVRLRIVGPVEPGPVMDMASDTIEVCGFVDDVQDEIARADVVIVPLRIGGGTRLKILEAMSMGKAIVSTRIGAEGIDLTHEGDVLLADEPADFARCVTRVMDEPDLRERLGAQARTTAVDRYSWASSASAMRALFTRTLSR